MPGSGLLKGLGVTLRTFLRPSVTQEYPDEKPSLPARSRGVIALKEENCTVCMACARACPDWCIYIESHKEVVPPKEPGARPRTRNVLDRFAIDFALCMYCGLCVEACPFDALFWAPYFEYSTYEVKQLLHEKETLGRWMAYVPPPDPLEDGAEQPKELEAGARPARSPARTEEPARRGPSGPTDEAGVREAASGAGRAPEAVPPVRTVPEEAPGEPKAAEGAREHREVGMDEEVYQAEIAKGTPERVARAKAKSAWMRKQKEGRGG